MSEEHNLPELSKEAQSILDHVKKLTVMDLANLVKHLEKEFGVSAAAPVAVAVAGGGAGGGGDAGDGGAPAEKTEFKVELISAGAAKIAIIKVIREITGLGLKEAKDLVDGAPKTVKEKVSKDEAEKIKKALVEAGATVEVK